jgi:EAL domain-containing protein (putative c-di-GMP-specific phosphodiesterase class I)
MSAWSFTVAGVAVEPVFQQYVCIQDPDLLRGELLSRPVAFGRVEEFFASLDYDQQLQALTAQLEIKEEFTAATDCRMSINVDHSLLDTDDQRDAFIELLGRFPTPATFEFTETHPMPPMEVSNHLLRRIRELGHMSALDDFGTAMNGMSLLSDYDFDVVKVDRSLVFDVLSRVEKQKTVRLINRMLAVLGKRHVVEGIDDDEVYRLLCKAGFTTFQGFLFHEPEPLDEVVSRLNSVKVGS